MGWWDGRTFTAGLFSGSPSAPRCGYQQRWVSPAMGVTRAVDTRAICKRPPTSTFCYLIDIGQPEVLLHKAGMFAAPRPGDGVDSLSARERRNVSRRIGLGWLFLAVSHVSVPGNGAGRVPGQKNKTLKKNPNQQTNKVFPSSSPNPSAWHPGWVTLV